MAEIAEGFEALRAELAARGTIEQGLSTGRIELLGRAEVEKLATEWWDNREAVRKPQVDDITDRRDLLTAIREEAAQIEEEATDAFIRETIGAIDDAGSTATPSTSEHASRPTAASPVQALDP